MAMAMITLRSWLAARTKAGDDERGASLVEYALLVGFIAVVCVMAVTLLGTATSANYSSTANGFAAN